MATGQSILNLAEVLYPELQLQSGEQDVIKTLLILNAGQDWFESLLSLHPNVLGSITGTVTTTASTESTAFPTGLLRLDRLQFLDTNSRPAWDLYNLRSIGGHAPSNYWPLTLGTTSGGRPRGYYTNGRHIYWDPLPDATYTVRWYGLQAAADITAGGTFAYPDIALLPFASFTVRVIKEGLDDDTTAIQGLATDLFAPVILALSNFNRDGAAPLDYRYSHDT